MAWFCSSSAACSRSASPPRCASSTASATCPGRSPSWSRSRCHGPARICRAHHPDGHRLCGLGRHRRDRHGHGRHALVRRAGNDDPMLLILGIVACIAGLSCTRMSYRRGPLRLGRGGAGAARRRDDAQDDGRGDALSRRHHLRDPRRGRDLAQGRRGKRRRSGTRQAARNSPSPSRTAGSTR